jgi:hypothetical protein
MTAGSGRASWLNRQIIQMYDQRRKGTLPIASMLLCFPSLTSRARRLESRDRGNDLLRPHNGTGIVRHIDVERGMHLLI